MRGRTTLLPALALALLTVACGKDDDGNGGTGPESSTRSFQATVSGDLSTSLSGSAVFSEAMPTPVGSTGWGLTLLHDEQSGMGITIARLSARPGEGTHAIVDMEDFDAAGPAAQAIFAVFLYHVGEDQGALLSTGGELRVTQSSETRMRGTFQITATGSLIEGGEVRTVSVTISGSFDAAR